MSIWPDQRLLDLLQVEHALIQAPMAGSSTPALAAAASNAGALGSLACAMMDRDGVRGTVAELRERTNRAFNVNFFCHEPPGEDARRNARARELLDPFFRELGLGDVPPVRASNFPFGPEMLELMLELRPPVVSFHFGLPDASLLGPLKDAGVVVLSSATTPGEARRLEAMGVDAVIAQGFEAGGHRGHFQASYDASCIGTFALVPQVVDAVDVPVIAAGGIADGRTLAAVLATGADGAWIGTGFRAVTECREIGQEERAAILAANGARTIRSRVTDIIKHEAQGGRDWPAEIANRTARTPTVERWHGREDALQAAIAENPAAFAETPAGEKPYLFSDATDFIHKEETAADFMARICNEATAHLRAAAVRAG